MVTEKSRIAALVALADAGIPVDVQELLLKNNAFDKALEAALSTDAEPVMYVSEKQLAQCVGHYVPSRKEADGNFQLALYRAPPAPSVAVKADLPERSEEWWTGRDSKGEKTLDYNQRKQLAWDAFYAAALSAQVQDVTRDFPAEFEKWWEDAGHYVGGVVNMTYTQRKLLAWDAFYAAAALAAPVQDVAVPEGWQLVPKEPTAKMHRAAWASFDNGMKPGKDWTACNSSVWRAMLAAAPAAKLEGKP